MTYFWETADTIAPGLGWPHFGPFHLAVLAVFLLLGAVLCRGYCGMDTDKRRRWRRTVALLLVADELFKEQAASEQLRRQIKGYLDEAAKAQAEASELKREVFRLQQRLENRNNGQNRQNSNGGNGR